MLRKLCLAALLAVAAPTLSVDAWANPVTKEDLTLMKAEVKYAKSVAKSVEKLAKKWGKAQDKGKSTTEIEKDLKTYYRNELAWLREKGIKTVEEEPKRHHPAHPPKVLPEPEAERPKLEELRDMCVALRKGDLKPREYRNTLNNYSKRLWERYERKARAYDKAKASAK